MRKRWKTTVRQGRLILPDTVEFRRLLDSLEGKDVDLGIKKWEPFSTDNQFAYYYGIVLKVIAEKTGYSRDDLDLILKNKFLYTYVPLGDSIERRLLSKQEITSQEFSEFIETVTRWAAEKLELVIPDPNEVGIEAYV